MCVVCGDVVVCVVCGLWWCTGMCVVCVLWCVCGVWGYTGMCVVCGGTLVCVWCVCCGVCVVCGDAKIGRERRVDPGDASTGCDRCACANWRFRSNSRRAARYTYLHCVRSSVSQLNRSKVKADTMEYRSDQI